MCANVVRMRNKSFSVSGSNRRRQRHPSKHKNHPNRLSVIPPSAIGVIFLYAFFRPYGSGLERNYFQNAMRSWTGAVISSLARSKPIAVILTKMIPHAASNFSGRAHDLLRDRVLTVHIELLQDDVDPGVGRDRDQPRRAELRHREIGGRRQKSFHAVMPYLAVSLASSLWFSMMLSKVLVV